MQNETQRLLRQSSAFNSTFVVDAQGVLQAISPAPLRKMIGARLQTLAPPRHCANGTRWCRRRFFPPPATVVVLSQPIFDAKGGYLGYVGGTLYLREHNILKSLLGEHFYKDGSYLYVVDRNRRLLYHPDAERVGTVVQGNALIDELEALGNGTQQVRNSTGVDMLAGFATVPSTGWGIVAQQPLAQTVAPLKRLILDVVGISAPLALLGCLVLWWLAVAITRPLQQLAASARALDRPGTAEGLQRVKAWYFEAAELKRALLFGLNLLQERIGRLNRAAQTDPLTGLGNRRHWTSACRCWRLKPVTLRRGTGHRPLQAGQRWPWA